MLQSLQGNSRMGTAERGHGIPVHGCGSVQGTGSGCTGSPLPLLQALLVQPKGGQQKVWVFQLLPLLQV